MARSATRNKVGKDPAYLRWIRSLPCVVCGLPWDIRLTWVAYSNVQETATEAAHVGDRGLSQKAPDSTAIPLCKQHHTEGKDAAHKLQKKFWEFHGLDRDALIRELNARYSQERAA